MPRRTIEEATPSLKNSLINFLLLRNDRQGMKEIVFQAVERQAASDIAACRSKRPSIAAADPRGLRAVRRDGGVRRVQDSVAERSVPNASPACWRRGPILPGRRACRSAMCSRAVRRSITARRNRSPRSSAATRDDDTIVLRYTTADGQTVDQPVEMALAAGDLDTSVYCRRPKPGSFVPGWRPAAERDLPHRRGRRRVVARID